MAGSPLDVDGSEVWWLLLELDALKLNLLSLLSKLVGFWMNSCVLEVVLESSAVRLLCSLVTSGGMLSACPKKTGCQRVTKANGQEFRSTILDPSG